MAQFDVFDPLRNITPKFTEEQLKDVIEWFDANAKPQLTINDGEPINVISIEKLIDFLNLKKFHRRSFHYPTYAEIMNEAEKLKAGVLRLITKEQMIFMLNKWVIGTTLKHELLLAFKVFDTEQRSFLEVDEIEFIVTQLGDVFSPSETKELIRDANVRGDGNVYYEYFIESMFSLAPELKEVQVDYIYDNPDEDPSVPSEPILEVPELPLPSSPVAAPAPPVTPKHPPPKKGRKK